MIKRSIREDKKQKKKIAPTASMGAIFMHICKQKLSFSGFRTFR